MSLPAKSLFAPLLLVAACGGGAEEPDAQAGDAAVEDAMAVDASLPETAYPTLLRDTGLYADFDTLRVADNVQAYTPAYPLWSDGADKQRWILLPEGAQIDSTDMNQWLFPEGTKFWKEFRSGDSLRIETRLMWKNGPDSADWVSISYAWNEAQNEATAVPEGAKDVLGTTFDIPREGRCGACHGNQSDFALGFGAIQLAHQEPGINLETLVTDLILSAPPMGDAPYFTIPGAGAEKQVLGYLHGNCGGCHVEGSSVLDKTPVLLRLNVEDLATVEDTTTYKTTVGVAPELGIAGVTAVVEPGFPSASAVYVRMNQRGTTDQMPRLGTEVVDDAILPVLEQWILGLGTSSEQAPSQ